LLLLVLLNDSKTRAQEQIPRVSTGFLASPKGKDVCCASVGDAAASRLQDEGFAVGWSDKVVVL
jgi:hypothetical protein